MLDVRTRLPLTLMPLLALGLAACGTTDAASVDPTESIAEIQSALQSLEGFDGSSGGCLDALATCVLDGAELPGCMDAFKACLPEPPEPPKFPACKKPGEDVAGDGTTPPGPPAADQTPAGDPAGTPGMAGGAPPEGGPPAGAPEGAPEGAPQGDPAAGPAGGPDGAKGGTKPPPMAALCQAHKKLREQIRHCIEKMVKCLDVTGDATVCVPRTRHCIKTALHAKFAHMCQVRKAHCDEVDAPADVTTKLDELCAKGPQAPSDEGLPPAPPGVEDGSEE